MDHNWTSISSPATRGGPLWSHNFVVSCWRDCVRDVDLHHKPELETEVDGNKDITVYDSDCRLAVDVDIAFKYGPHAAKRSGEKGVTGTTRSSESRREKD